MPMSATYSLRLNRAFVPVLLRRAAGLLWTASTPLMLARPAVMAEPSATVRGVTGTSSSSIAAVPTRSSCAAALVAPGPRRAAADAQSARSLVFIIRGCLEVAKDRRLEDGDLGPAVDDAELERALTHPFDVDVDQVHARGHRQVVRRLQVPVQRPRSTPSLLSVLTSEPDTVKMRIVAGSAGRFVKRTTRLRLPVS